MDLLSMSSGFESLKKDSTSGSVALVNKLIQMVQQVLLSPVDQGEVFALLKEELRALIAIHQEMVVLSHFIHPVVDFIELPDHGQKSRQTLLNNVQEYSRRWGTINERIAKNAINVLNLHEKNILLHSHSSAIIEVITLAKKQHMSPSIVQTESRPGMEGRIQAKKLLDLGINVRMIVDMAVKPELNKIDLVLFGADAYTSELWTNKIGSGMICLAAKEKNIPVYVLADSRKKVKTLPPYRERPPHEIWSEFPPGLHLSNHYFEEISIDHMTRIITECPESSLF